MGFFKKLTKGIGNVAKKVGRGIGKAARFAAKPVVKAAGAFLTSGLVPVPGVPLVGKLVSKVGDKIGPKGKGLAGALIKTAGVAGGIRPPRLQPGKPVSVLNSFKGSGLKKSLGGSLGSRLTQTGFIQSKLKDVIGNSPITSVQLAELKKEYTRAFGKAPSATIVNGWRRLTWAQATRKLNEFRAMRTRARVTITRTPPTAPKPIQPPKVRTPIIKTPRSTPSFVPRGKLPTMNVSQPAKTGFLGFGKKKREREASQERTQKLTIGIGIAGLALSALFGIIRATK